MPVTITPGVTGISKQGSNQMRGAVILAAGENVTLNQSGQVLTINSIDPADVVINSAQAEVDFGFQSGGEGDSATATIEASWVTTSSNLVCTPYLYPTADHDPNDYWAEGIIAYPENIVEGVSFDVVAIAPNNTFGKYLINVMGV